jgi:hypothetical protein
MATGCTFSQQFVCTNKYYCSSEMRAFSVFHSRYPIEACADAEEYDTNMLTCICRLAKYRETVRERAQQVQLEEEKQKLRGQVLGNKVDGPDMDAFLRQLSRKDGAQECTHLREASFQVASRKYKYKRIYI